MQVDGKHVFLFDLAVDLNSAERNLQNVKYHGIADKEEVQDAVERVDELRGHMRQATVKDLTEDLKLSLTGVKPRYDKSLGGEKLLFRYKSNW